MEAIFLVYFYTFSILLPASFFTSGIVFLIENRKEKLQGITKFISVIFIVLNFVVIIELFIFFRNSNYYFDKIGMKYCYLIYYGITLLTYLLISFIESIALNPKKYMKYMTINLGNSLFKDKIIRDIHYRVVKFYFFVAYIVAVLLFQLESIEIYKIENSFLQCILKVCQDSLALILAMELIFKYKSQKRNETKELNNGADLFDKFFDFSTKYIKIYNSFVDKFSPLLYLKDNLFFEKVKLLNIELKSRLEDIKKTDGYEDVKESSKIKTYNIFFDTFNACINSFTSDKKSLQDRQAYIVYMVVYFKEIIQKEIPLKSEKQFLNKLCKFVNKNNKIGWTKHIG